MICRQYIIVSWCIWKLSKYVSQNISTWPCSFSYCSRISMASSLKYSLKRIRYFNWYQYVINDRERYQTIVYVYVNSICHAIHRYSKSKNKYRKNYDKNRESSYLKYWDVNNLYDWAMSQKLHVNDFKWVEDISKFDRIFIKSYNEESDEGHFLQIYIQRLQNLHNLLNGFPFLSERMKIEKLKKL